MLKKLKFEQTFDFLDLIKSWPHLVGDFLGPNSIPLRLKNMTLTVLVKHPVFSQELSFLSTQLIQKIEIKLPKLRGQIAKLQFEVNDSFFHQQTSMKNEIAEKKLHPRSPEVRILTAQAMEVFKDVDDPEALKNWISLYLQTHLDNK